MLVWQALNSSASCTAPWALWPNSTEVRHSHSPCALAPLGGFGALTLSFTNRFSPSLHLSVCLPNLTQSLSFRWETLRECWLISSPMHLYFTLQQVYNYPEFPYVVNWTWHIGWILWNYYEKNGQLMVIVYGSNYCFFIANKTIFYILFIYTLSQGSVFVCPWS